MNKEEETNCLLEIIEVFINCILYLRGIYPKKIFRKRVFYNTPVYKSIYPPLNTYITNVLKSAQYLNETKNIQKIEIVLHNKANDNLVLENYQFNIENNNFAANNIDDKYLLDFEEKIRTALLQLDERLKLLKPLPDDVEFKLNLHTSESAYVRLINNSKLQDFPWIQKYGENNTDTTNSTVLPIVHLYGLNIDILTPE